MLLLDFHQTSLRFRDCRRQHPVTRVQNDSEISIERQNKITAGPQMNREPYRMWKSRGQLKTISCRNALKPYRTSVIILVFTGISELFIMSLYGSKTLNSAFVKAMILLRANLFVMVRAVTSSRPFRKIRNWNLGLVTRITLSEKPHEAVEGQQ